MRIAENEGAEFHDGNEASEVEDFGVGVTAIDNTRKVEKFCALVDFCPETLFKGFFGGLEGSGLFYEIEVGENANDFWKTMGLQDV
jgi:hypothetical protein